MAEQLLVGLIVFVAACYAAWHICPASTRLALLKRLRPHAECTPVAPYLPALERAAGVTSGACAGCGARSRCPMGRGVAVTDMPRRT